jgi:guanylate kinase
MDARRTGDTSARLQAWDETAELRDADLALNTAELSAEAAAQRIYRHVAIIGGDPSSTRRSGSKR